VVPTNALETILQYAIYVEGVVIGHVRTVADVGANKII